MTSRMPETGRKTRKLSKMYSPEPKLKEIFPTYRRRAVVKHHSLQVWHLNILDPELIQRMDNYESFVELKNFQLVQFLHDVS